jgi:hypothetical protein
LFTQALLWSPELVFSALEIFSADKIVPQTQIREQFKKSNQFQFYGGGKAHSEAG